MKRLALLLLLAFLALAVWLAARGGGARRDPVERLVTEMVQIPGRDYRMGKYEVTQAQWEAVMGENPSYFKGADHPVECVSWYDCQAFLEKLNAHPAARARRTISAASRTERKSRTRRSAAWHGMPRTPRGAPGG